MLRFILFFVAVIFLTRWLSHVPAVGVIFQIPFLGFWFTAILLSIVLAKVGTDAVDRGAVKKLERSLGVVDTPHHKGKLGSLLLSQGRAKKAVPLFQAAVDGDPSSREWRNKLGVSLLQSGGDPKAALAAFDSVLAEDDEFGFGSAMLGSARAAHAAGFSDNALERLAYYERDQGPGPESALLRAKIHKDAGDRPAAAKALDEIPGILKAARGSAGSRTWTIRLRALMLRLLP